MLSVLGDKVARKWIRTVLLFWFFSIGSGLEVCENGKLKIQTVSCPQTITVTNYLNLTENQLLGLAMEFSESDQMVALECSKGPISRTMENYGMSCYVKILRPEESCSRKQLKKVAENFEMADEWPLVQEESTVWWRYLSFLKKEYVSHAFHYVISATSNIFQETSKYRLFGELLTEYLWVFVIVSLSFTVALYTRHRMLLSEQPQKLPVLSLHLPKGVRVLFCMGGVMLSVWLFRHFSAEDTSWRKQMLVNMCDERARLFEDQFNSTKNNIHDLAVLVSTFHHGKLLSGIDQKSFSEYARRTAFGRPLTSGVAYALKVVHSERERFEKAYGFKIKKMEAAYHQIVHAQYSLPKKLDTAPANDEYAPVVFAQESVSHIISIDMMSGKEDCENVLRARATGLGVLSSPLKLLKSNQLAVVLTFAVYNKDMPLSATPEERVEATKGYLGASIDFPSLLEKLLNQLESKETIVVDIYDTTNASSPINLCREDVTDTYFLRVSPLDFGDPLRNHEMHCRFKQQSPWSWRAIMWSSAVFIITFFVAHYSKMVERKARAEADDMEKSQFLSTVFEKITIPMNGILGMLPELDASQEDFAYTASVEGLVLLVDKLVDEAKIESGRPELEDVPFDLRAVLNNVLSLFSRKSSNNGIENGVVEVVNGDPGRFQQKITKLVENSMKIGYAISHLGYLQVGCTSSSVTQVGFLNNDPNRPRLQDGYVEEDAGNDFRRGAQQIS